MPLTPAQQATLKAHIAANTATVLINDQPTAINAVPISPDNCLQIANWYAGEADPAFIVWRSSVSRQEILQNGFDWTRLDNLSVGKARVWQDIFAGEGGTMNPSKLNVRVGIESVWVGTAADLAVRAAVYVHCKMNASHAQKLFATGTGSDATPATMAVEEPLTYLDVLDAMNLPA